MNDLIKCAMENLTIVKDFLQQHIPIDILSTIGWTSFQLQKDSYLDENLKNDQIDFLYRVSFGEMPGYIYVLVIRRTSADPLLSFHLLASVIRIISHHLEKYNSVVLPFVYPLVVCDEEFPSHEITTDVFKLFDKHEELVRELWFKPFHLIDLNQIPDEDFHKNLWAGTFLFVMKYAKDKEICSHLERISDQLDKINQQGGSDYIREIFQYIFAVNKSDEPEKLAALANKYFFVEEDTMTVADYFIQKGFEEGLEKGKSEGKEEGYQQGVFETVKKFLRGGLSIEYISNLVQLTPDQLQLLSREIQATQIL